MAGLVRRRKLRWESTKSGRSGMYVVTIPREYVELLGWRLGDELELELDIERREIRVRKARTAS